MATNEPGRTPAWLRRMEAETSEKAPDIAPVDEAPRSVSGPAAVDSEPPSPSAEATTGSTGIATHGGDMTRQLEEAGIARLREEATRAARQDAEAGVPDTHGEGQTGSERDLRERCRAFYDRWSFQYRRHLHDEVADREEAITDRLGRASLAVDRFERLTNELMRLKARRAVREREVASDLAGDERGERGLSTKVYLGAILFLGLVEFFANAPVFQALLPRDVLTERQIRLVTETSSGWFAGAERVIAHLILRPDAALLAAGVVTFLCVLAHFFGHSLRELIMQRDTAERHHTVSARSPIENVIPMVLTGLGLLLVLGVLYEARIRLGEVGRSQYEADMGQVQEWRRQADLQVADGNLLEANALRGQAEDLAQAADALRNYADSMSRLSFPILLLNTTLVICALCAAYFHRRDRRREHFNENPFERDRGRFIETAETTATEVSEILSDLAKHIRGLKSVTAAAAREEQRAMVRELESVISLYRAENGRARGIDPRSIVAFRDRAALEIEIEPYDDEAIQPLRSPTEYDAERRELHDRFQAVRQRFNEEAIAW